jgi:phosphoribosylformimino-5-aminoimidazole carboxamide ribotide isomerase
LIPFIQNYVDQCVCEVICTDVAKDGLLQGPAFALYAEILRANPGLKLIASGGVSCYKDLEELQKIGVYATIVGKAYYEDKLTLQELASFQGA